MDRVFENVKARSFVRCERHCFTKGKKKLHSIKREVREACFKLIKERKGGERKLRGNDLLNVQTAMGRQVYYFHTLEK